MRDILYQGKQRDNGEWVEGLYMLYLKDGYHDIYEHIIIPVPYGMQLGISYTEEAYIVDYAEVDPDTIGEYTGLYDSKGNKIYEGHILRYCDLTQYHCYEDSLEDPDAYDGEIYKPDYKYGAVFYDTEYLPGFDITNHDFDCNGLSELICSGDYHYEVIGNIHDYPNDIQGEKL